MKYSCTFAPVCNFYCMRLFLNISLMAAMAITAVSCKRAYNIEGRIDFYGYDGEMLYLITHENDEFAAVDSCCVRHGLFSMKGKTDSTVFSVLCHGFEPLMPLMIEPGKLQVKVSPSEIEAKGTKLNNQLYDFLDKKNAIDNRFEDAFQRSQRMSAVVNPTENSEDSLKAIVDEAEDFFFDFVSKHYSDPLGVAIFLMLCTGDDIQEPTPLLKRIVDDAPDKFLANYKVRKYLEMVGMD